MRRKLLAIAIVSALVATAGVALATTQQKNRVYFDGPALQNVSFTPSGHSVTAGQPFGGASATIQKGQIEINVLAGRKRSAAVSTWFKQAAGGGQTLVCDSPDTYPNELNFAVQGDLSFTMNNRHVTCKNLIFAQGNFGANNNWWVSSPTMQGIHISITGATAQTCAVKGELLPVLVVFTPKTPCVSHFNIATYRLVP